ncbi:aggregative adherence fimbria II major subunit AafA [Escherichia coli]|nr:aggregative adherence fimbria II major subunit AafA [Escherichia coli]
MKKIRMFVIATLLSSGAAINATAAVKTATSTITVVNNCEITIIPATNSNINVDRSADTTLSFTIKQPQRCANAGVRMKAWGEGQYGQLLIKPQGQNASAGYTLASPRFSYTPDKPTSTMNGFILTNPGVYQLVMSGSITPTMPLRPGIYEVVLNAELVTI